MVVAWSVHLEPCGNTQRSVNTLQPLQPREPEGAPVGHLLVEESPEHGQRDVEEQNLQDHLHLCDQKFLGARKEEKVFREGCLGALVQRRDGTLTSYFSSAQSIQ